MNEQEALARMVAPGTPREGKYRRGVIQIHVTRACDKACYGCTQGSNLGGKLSFLSPELFEQALLSLRGYFGVVGVFGGNPALHPRFEELCEILRRHVPFNQRGLWCNHPVSPPKARAMRATFDPAVSNLNVHLDEDAYAMFKQHWPECSPVGLHRDSRHSPPYVALKDVLKKSCEACGGSGEERIGSEPTQTCEPCRGRGWYYDEERAWELISDCDINKHWSAMIGAFRGELRAWFCEIAGAQSILHQDDPDYPDTGIVLPQPKQDFCWWEFPMQSFAHQVRKHCHECGVPLRGHGELAQATDGIEQVSETHRGVFCTKRVGRRVELVTTTEQLGTPLGRMTDYLGNAKR